MKVACNLDHVDLDGDYAAVEGVRATCCRCGHDTESYGTSEASVRRCLAMLRDECPNGEGNYYYDVAETRQSPLAAAYERGYADGYATASRGRRWVTDRG